MDTFWGILSFRVFVTPSLLLIGYYLGALGVPLLAAYLLRVVRRRVPQLFTAVTLVGEDPEYAAVRWKMVLFFSVIFTFMELAWRVMFEFVIAYFQMHEALMHLSGN